MRRGETPPGPVTPWGLARQHRDRLWDPPRKPPPRNRARCTRTTLEPQGVCRFCNRLKFNGGNSCGRRTCPGYLPLWLGDQRMRLWLNLLEYGGDVAMVAVTAPGVAEGLPWDTRKCSHPAEQKCSGRHGCVVLAAAADDWNRTADRRWSKLHDAAAAAVRRKHGPGALRLLAYSTEMQRRGVLHLHLVLGVATVRQRAAAHHYVNNLARLSRFHCWGNVDRGQMRGGRRSLEIVPAFRAAAYVSKYLVKEASAGGIGELVMSGNAPARPVYVAGKLTATTRCTMRNLRLRRALYVRSGQHFAPTDVEGLWRLVQTFGAEFLPDPLESPETGAQPPPEQAT